ncbi:MAG TPA: 23S rRNA (adenine(2503)-C(2))-methyltransferase RlmN [Candidatus Marinimicrobia bacterium]|nr:23S rRNA (adenine(2503)-C(2))-methyltransferase RlmN [Candidatus Neomarinimicrobiota bacterium]HRS50872.1 23S rRNA (adenine(2503)-C(2))-methyltransferase RlmN [Candidatus Neomarinimicrobiota bacterium]HRU91786.1 23S rRNA (adenine(2503)-C(2))-methyltransferase RlmN [Candidatus Neomarinimicrobiota bacterium]
MHTSAKINLKGLNLEEITSQLAALGEKPYRARQIYQWLYQKNATDWNQMTNIPLVLRTKLAERFELNSVHLKKTAHSQIDGSVKFLFELADGHLIEAVYMPEERRRTVCLSSQVGCPIGCAFCATGLMGLKRNLTAGEIVDQLLFINANMPNPATNVVFMGMGEPFLNYENVIHAAQIFNSELGPELSARHITISTCGIIPGIKRFTAEDQRFKLAISLNATTDDQRDKIIPVNHKYPIKELLNAAKNYTRVSRRRVTFEYILIAGLNDTTEDARRLVKLLSPIPCKLNLIPYNENPQFPYHAPNEEHLNEFIREIYRAPFAVTVRRSKGLDIAAACGQLYVTEQNKRNMD